MRTSGEEINPSETLLLSFHLLDSQYNLVSTALTQSLQNCWKEDSLVQASLVTPPMLKSLSQFNADFRYELLEISRAISYSSMHS